MSYIRGEDRHQGALFPVTLEELIPEDHLVRVIEAYIAGLDLAALGFAKALTKVMGRPPYDPTDLLKLYLYGYLNQVRSSRRLGEKGSVTNENHLSPTPLLRHMLFD